MIVRVNDRLTISIVKSCERFVSYNILYKIRHPKKTTLLHRPDFSTDMKRTPDQN